MAIPSSTFTVLANTTDGVQRLSDPTGGYVPPTEIDPPTNLRVIANGYDSQQVAWSYNGTGQTGFDVERWITGIDSGWMAMETVGSAARSWDSTGLPSNTTIRHRVRATATDGSTSTWAEIERATDYPPTAGGTDWDRIGLYEDFRNTPIGAKTENNVSYMSAAGNGVTSTTETMSGLDRSMRTHLPAGQEGYGVWGFNIDFPSSLRLKSPGEIWYRTQVWYPPGFVFSSSGGKSATKGMRLNRYRVSDNSNRNHIDMYYLPTGSSSSQIRPTLITEEPDGSSWDDVNGTFSKGQWATLEMYSNFDRPSVDDGGNGEMRFWIDGQEVAHFTHLIPHGESQQNYILLARWHTWWNGGSKDGDYHYCQSYAFAFKGTMMDGSYRDDTPYLSRDSSGFPYIGMGNKA